MPYSTRKVRGKNCYKVYNKKTKRVFSQCATKENAAKQIRLLRAMEFNKDFVPRGKMRGITYKKSKK
jgi:hypothetical protein